MSCIAIILNPVSGVRTGPARRAQIEAALAARGVDVQWYETTPEMDAGQCARQAIRNGCTRIIVSGGDGSVKQAAEVVLGKPIELAILPGGTANLLALNINIPLAPLAALDLALNGEARPIDVGRANGEVFLVVAGFGLDARLNRDTPRAAKQRLGVIAYIQALWRNLGLNQVRYDVIVDGHKHRRRADSVVIMNGGRIAMGVRLLPQATLDDGALHVVVIQARTWFDVFRIYMRAWVGFGGPSNRLEIFEGRDIRIYARKPLPLHIDGELRDKVRRLYVQIDRNALNVVRPPVPSPVHIGGVPTRPLPLAAGIAAGLVAGFLVFRRLTADSAGPDRVRSSPPETLSRGRA